QLLGEGGHALLGHGLDQRPPQLGHLLVERAAPAHRRPVARREPPARTAAFAVGAVCHRRGRVVLSEQPIHGLGAGSLSISSSSLLSRASRRSWSAARRRSFSPRWSLARRRASRSISRSSWASRSSSSSNTSPSLMTFPRPAPATPFWRVRRPPLAE